MAKKIALLRKTRRKPNKNNRKLRNEKIVLLLIILFIIGSFVMSFLEKKGVINTGEIFNRMGIISGVDNQDSDFAVYYLDAGQSDCTIIKSNDEVMMIDAGTDVQFDNIMQSLKSLNISKIDYLVITHQHDDHMGGANDIIGYCDVKNIILPELSEMNMVTTYSYEQLLEAIIDKGINAISAKPGFTFTLGNGLAEIFAPVQQDENLNNMSVVLKITYKNNSFLFQGDAEKKVENALLKSDCNLSANVIKLGHHGSNTSSTEKYLKAVNPSVAIISCGADNSYGHPHTEVLERLKKNSIDAYITSLDGNIIVTSDGNKITVKTEKGEKVTSYG